MISPSGVELQEVAHYIEQLLGVSTTPDYPQAMNGVQLGHQGPVRRVAGAVDFSRATVEAAIAAGANLLLLHHGMFWGGLQPIVGRQYERLRRLMMNDVAVYACHLPLDRDPDIGNAVLLARALGLEPVEGFGAYRTITVGASGACDLPTRDIAARLAAVAGEWDGHVVTAPMQVDRNRRTRRWAIVTGAGASSETLREAADRGIDTLVTGEGPHHTAVDAEEHGVVVLYAGHYATETLGIRALAQRVGERFDVPWDFLRLPTGT